jgi:hypothetical protein
MKWCTFLIGIVVCISSLPGCQKGKSESLSPEHKTLIAEFEVFKARQCACRDAACSREMGQKIGPRVQEVMRDVEKLPKEVQVKLGSLLAQMTDCAKRTQKPE